ncbi:MAG TPA: hypothetical protein VF801_13485 [Rhodocyclaceae bacterium]
MNKSIALALSALALAAGASIAAADEAAFPHALTAAELQKLHGERAVTMTTSGARHLRYEFMPDGKVIGHNTDLIGGAAVAAGTSDGKWHVDAAANKICFEWANARWQNNCLGVVQTAADAYEWSPSGLKLSFTPK